MINRGTRDNVFGWAFAQSSQQLAHFVPQVGIMLDLELMKSIAEQMMASAPVSINGKVIPVKRTGYQRLKTLAFDMNGKKYQAIEQNAEKPSRWGQLARAGHRVVQFKDVQTGKFVAVSVDGAVKEYAR